MEGDIELDDIQVVEVTGRAYRDRRPRGKKSGCSCNPSLRATTILIFVCIGIIYVIGVVIANVRMRISLEELDEGACGDSIDRFALLLYDDMVKLQQLTRHAAWSNLTAEVMLHPEDQMTFDYWLVSYLNNSAVYDENGMPVTDENGQMLSAFNTGSLINYWALIAPDTYETIWRVFYPDIGDQLVGPYQSEPAPILPPKFFKQMFKEERDATEGWFRLYNPDFVEEPLIVTVEAIMVPNDYGEIVDKTIYGYVIAARTLRPRLSLFADAIPSCISIISRSSDADDFDKTDKKVWKESTAGTITGKRTFSGKPAFAQREKKYMEKSQTRVCPAVPLFNMTDNVMAGYVRMCGFDPKEDENSCFYVRMDRPMSMVDQGTGPVITLSIEIIAMMVILCVIFVIFLDCVVLRRIVNLSNVIRKQTRGHAEARKDIEEDTATMSVAEEKHSGGGKRGKSARGSTEGSRTSTSSDGGGAAAVSPHDELGNLKRVMEQNALGLRKRLEAVNESIKIEQQKTIRHKQAMQLLNLWCGRKDYFPGLRPNAMQLRYEPNRSLDDLLANPLAIEYLKSHCDSDRSLENLWFLLDVSWLHELENAEDHEEDPQKRNQIHEVASASAMTILTRYIALNAPQQINISAASFKTLREKGDVYERGMFDPAVGEVKLMLNTDILPRFQKSAAYSAMSETLFIDNSGGGDESEFSDETVSTAGSILTDEGEDGEGGVARVFAHTFKNLHNTFDVGHDADASSTYSADSSRATNTLTSNAPVTASLVAGTQTTTTADKDTVESSKESKEGSTVSDSEGEKKEEPKMEEPKKEEPKKEEPKKEEPKKAVKAAKNDESDSSSDSSDSSSHSISSSSMTMSNNSDASSSSSD